MMLSPKLSPTDLYHLAISPQGWEQLDAIATHAHTYPELVNWISDVQVKCDTQNMTVADAVAVIGLPPQPPTHTVRKKFISLRFVLIGFIVSILIATAGYIAYVVKPLSSPARYTPSVSHHVTHYSFANVSMIQKKMDTLSALHDTQLLSDQAYNDASTTGYMYVTYSFLMNDNKMYIRQWNTRVDSLIHHSLGTMQHTVDETIHSSCLNEHLNTDAHNICNQLQQTPIQISSLQHIKQLLENLKSIDIAPPSEEKTDHTHDDASHHQQPTPRVTPPRPQPSSKPRPTVPQSTPPSWYVPPVNNQEQLPDHIH